MTKFKAIAKSIAYGSVTFIFLTWLCYLMIWPFMIDDLPAWVNWVSGISFVLFMIVIFAQMHYEGSKS